MREVIRELIYLASSAVNGTEAEPDCLTAIDMDALYNFACEQKMEALAAYALDAAGVHEPRFADALDSEIRRAILFDLDLNAVLAGLEERKIWHLPLKGAVMREYYPQIGMRQMADFDILFDPQRAEDVRELMESLGFRTVHYGQGHQDDYQKEPVSHFEMHRMLFSDHDQQLLYRYFQDFADRRLPEEGFRCRFSNEDFYLFMLAHAFKHADYSGIGLRALLDIYVFLVRFEDHMDWDYLRRELDACGILDFEDESRRLAQKIFIEGKTDDLDDAELRTLSLYAQAGMYGNDELLYRRRVEKTGRLGYFLGKMILPMNKVKRFYPFFYSHKFLLPLLPFYRLAAGRKRAARELRAVWKAARDTDKKKTDD